MKFHSSESDEPNPKESLNVGWGVLHDMYHWWANQHAFLCGSKRNMVNLVAGRRGLGVTDPRDMVWAHIGLADDGKEPAFLVGYENRTLPELYNSFAQHVFQDEKTFRILLLVEQRDLEPHLNGLASWSPNWRKQHTLFNIAAAGKLSFEMYFGNASESQLGPLHWPENI